MNPKYFWLALIFLYASHLQAQFTQLADMPERVSNNAVVSAVVNEKPYVYSFCGIDSTKTWSGIHLKAWRLDVEANVWSSIPDVPDPAGGKIAASANVINGKIYLVGGYHVAQSGHETSSAKVHVFDTQMNNWLPDAASIPVPIDDQVQTVWKDSLLYVVTGWSNTTNVNLVQVFDPSENTWHTGTALPDDHDFKVFGGAGIIINDTIFYAGGAKSTFNFPPTSVFRKGIINPDHPTEIEWSKVSREEAKGYRMAAAVHEERAVWLGGSDVTYNFNGIAYNNSGGVSPLDRITVYDPISGNFFQKNDKMPFVMDLRGAAQINDNEVIIAGGMISGQQVSNKVWRIPLDDLTGVEDGFNERAFFNIYPNPAHQELSIEYPGQFEMEMFDANSSFLFYKNATDRITFSIANLAPGIYWLDLVSEQGFRATKKVVIN